MKLYFFLRQLENERNLDISEERVNWEHLFLCVCFVCLCERRDIGVGSLVRFGWTGNLQRKLVAYDRNGSNFYL